MINNDVQLQKYNSFHLLSRAEYYFEFFSHEELIDFLKGFEIIPKLTVLGSGTNVVLPPIVKGLVLKSKNKTIIKNKINDSFIIIESGAGTNWDEFVAYALNKGAQGIANLSSIPGSVGAAPVQNIGAYGKDVSDFIDSVVCLDIETMNIIEISNKNCKFSYRWSIFKEKKNFIVLSVRFKFLIKKEESLNSFIKTFCVKKIFKLVFSAVYVKNNRKFIGLKFEKIRDFLLLKCLPEKFKRKLVIWIRKKTMIDPDKTGNVGCFFKALIVDRKTLDHLLAINPKINFFNETNILFKVSVGDLIKSSVDLTRNGNVFINPNRPLVVLNASMNNNSTHILKFTNTISNAVFKKYGVNIEPEAVIL